MFEGLKNLKSLAGLMGQAGEVRERMERMRADLARREVSAEAGAGAVRITASGNLEIRRVELDPAMVGVLTGDGPDGDREMIEDLILSATNAALERAQNLVREEMNKATGLEGGSGLPGLGPDGPDLEGLDFSKLGEMLGGLGEGAFDDDEEEDEDAPKND